MGNQPSEYNGATCSTCGRSLPPMKSFDNLQNTHIDGRPVYIFNNGQYYRWHGCKHQCPDCFFRPKREREEQQRREEEERKRKEEEQRRKEEEQRRKEEEQKREEEEQKRREMERRQKQKEERQNEQKRQEASMKQANESAKNLEQESAEWHHKNESKTINNKMQQQKTSMLIPKFDDQDETEESEENRGYNAFDQFYYLFIELYDYELDYLDLEDLTPEEINELIAPLNELLKEKWLVQPPPNKDLITIVQFFALKIFLAQIKQPLSKELTNENEICFFIQQISASAQSLEETIYLTISLLATVQGLNESIALEETSLSILCRNLEENNRELLDEKHASEINEISLDLLENLLLNSIRTFPTLHMNPVIMKISSLIIVQSVNIFEFDDCSLQESFSNLVRNEIWDPKSIWAVLRGIIRQCSSIKEEVKYYCEILHLISTFYIGPNQIISGQTFLDLIANVKAERVLEQVSLFVDNAKDEIKELNVLLEEIHETKLVDTVTLDSVRIIMVNTKSKLGKYGYPDKGQAEKLEEILSNEMMKEWKKKIHVDNGTILTDINVLQESLVIISCGVNKINGWWPRDTQLISWCILMLSGNNGQLLEMNTGEGKSCVVAMFAAMLGCQGKFVDVVTSSPVLACRDAEEWSSFYSLFDLTVANNIKTKDDKSRKKCYQANIVHGTVANFASDILRQEFHMKDIRPTRTFDSVIIDEVDSMLLDQGAQFTYLSHETPGFNHLNPVLSMVWCSVSQFIPLRWDSEVMWCTPPQPFFKAMYDSIDPSACGVAEPLQLLKMGENNGLLSADFTERYEKAIDDSTKENEQIESKQDLLKQVDVETILNFYVTSEEYIPCNFKLYTLDQENLVEIDRESSTDNQSERIDISILVLGSRVCCILNESETDLREPIVEQIMKLVMPTTSEPDDVLLNIPKFLHPFIEERLSTWVENAFYSLKMLQGREYLLKEGNIIPVDYRSTGIIQLNKKWSNGLHQFLQMKHKQQLSPLTIVTNFISNIAFFKRYHNSLYGMTGTLGNANDHTFLSNCYNVRVSKIPTFCTQKLFQYDGVLCANKQSWENSIIESLKDKIAPKSWKGKGRAALIICHDINSANELYNLIVEKVSSKAKLYIRNDTDQLNIIHQKLEPQEIIVATNLAGRGTNIKVKSDVKQSGGLFVLVTFLPGNARVERQAFGRTARKGDPGSVQIIANLGTFPEQLLEAHSIANACYLRDEFSQQSIFQDDIEEVNLKEKLFAEYCLMLQSLHDLNCSYEEKKILASTLNEFWGIWLVVNTDKFNECSEKELINSLKQQISSAKSETLEKKSPSNNFYHLIKFGNEVLLYDYDYPKAEDLFSQAISKDPEWAVIAYYNRAYCRIKQESDDYVNKSREDLEKALKSLKKYKEQELIVRQLNDNSKSYFKESENKEESYFEEQINSKFQVYNFYEKNIQEAIGKLKEFKDDDVEAVESSIFSLVTDPDSQTHAELYILWQHGLLNVYSIKKKPRFCWEGLVVFLLGALQVVAGIALTVFSAGTLSNIGMGLIVEGVSDIMDGVIVMVTGEFSWEQWAISKAIGIATSLIGFGVGKLISKGFKGFKLAAKAFSKELKALPKLVSSQTKGGLTQVMKVNLKNAGKYAGKELAEEGILRGLQFAQDKVIEEFIEILKETIKLTIETSVHDSIFKGGLGATMDELVLQQIGGIENSFVLTAKDGPSERLEKIIMNFGSKVLDSYMKDLGWQNQLNTALQGTMLKIQARLAKEGKLAKYKVLFEIAEAVHMGVLLIDAANSIQSLLNEFDVSYSDSIEDFMDESESTQYNLSSPIKGNDHFTELKTNISKSLVEFLSEAIANVVHQKFTSHIVTKAQKKLNGKVIKFVGDRLLKGSEIESNLKKGEASLFISAMPAHDDASMASKLSHNYAINIQDSKTPGSILDLRIISEKLNVKVSILEPVGDNKYQKMLNIEPDSANSKTPTIQLIYRSSSTEYPEGHYDVLKNGKIISVDNENKDCSYHALSKAMYPDNTDEENRKKATYFRQLEGEELVSNSGKWYNFVKMKEQVQALTNSMWYLGIGGAKRAKRKMTDDDPKASREEIEEITKVRKKHPDDVIHNLDVKFQDEARERWDTVVVIETEKGKSEFKGFKVTLKYNKDGEDLTNRQLLETLAFFHEFGEKNAKGKLYQLKVKINIGQIDQQFTMGHAAHGVRQIYINTLNADYPSTTKSTASYKAIATVLDRVDGCPRVSSKPDFHRQKALYEEEKMEIIQKRAGMISKAITSTKDEQPDFNSEYTSKVDGKSYPYFNDQQKRSAVMLIAMTQIAEPCPPDDKFKLMLIQNSNKTPEQVKNDEDGYKKVLKILSQFSDGDDIIAKRAEIITEAIETGKDPKFDETYKSKSDGKDHKYFNDDQIKAAKLYIETERILKSTKTSDQLKKEIMLKKIPKKVTKTGRLPGTDKLAVELLDLMRESDYKYNFATMFSNAEWIPVYSPVISTENARIEFYQNSD